MFIESTSANLLKKRDRVIVRASKDEWYTGMVTRSGAKSLSVKFDDGLVAVISEEDFGDVHPMLIDYKSHDPLKDSDAQKLYQKAKLASNKAKLKVVLTPAKHETDAGALWAERLVKLQEPELFAKAYKTRNARAMLQWMEKIYLKLDKIYFEMELVRPILTILSVTEEHKWKCKGLWKANTRELSLGVSLFELDEFSVLKSLLHEMCHQAVTEVDCLVGIGHSESWRRWMYRVGMPVYMQTDLTHDVPAMLRFEPEDPKDLPVVEGVSKVKSNPSVPYEKFVEPPLTATPALMRSTSGVWRKGVVLGQWRRDTDFVWFLTTPSLDTHKRVQLSDVFKMPDDQQSTVKTPQWLASIARVTADLELKPRIFNTHGQVICSVCGKTVNSQVETVVSINREHFDVQHAAEKLGMPSSLLERLIKTRQLTET